MRRSDLWTTRKGGPDDGSAPFLSLIRARPRVVWTYVTRLRRARAFTGKRGGDASLARRRTVRVRRRVSADGLKDLGCPSFEQAGGRAHRRVAPRVLEGEPEGVATEVGESAGPLREAPGSRSRPRLPVADLTQLEAEFVHRRRADDVDVPVARCPDGVPANADRLKRPLRELDVDWLVNCGVQLAHRLVMPLVSSISCASVPLQPVFAGLRLTEDRTGLDDCRPYTSRVGWRSGCGSGPSGRAWRCQRDTSRE